jgi:hypothetical protein
MSSLLPKPSMIGLLPFALLVPVLLIPAMLARAETALDCLPPEPPSPVQDAALRAEYQQEIGAEYSDYFDAAQAYLHCLEAARANVTDEINRAIADYQSMGLGPPD